MTAFFEEQGIEHLSDLQQKHIDQYKQSKAEDVKPGSINRELSLLSRIYTIAKRQGYIRDDPTKGYERLREMPVESFVLTEKDLHEKFLPSSKDGSYEIKSLFHFAWLTGARLGEILGLRWNDVNLEKGYLIFRDTKGNEDRPFPIKGEVKSLLARLSQDRRGEWVFCTSDGTQRKDVRTALQLTCMRAKIPVFRFHCFRHSAISHMAWKGVPWETVSTLLGIRSYNVFLKYRHLFRRGLEPDFSSYGG